MTVPQEIEPCSILASNHAAGKKHVFYHGAYALRRIVNDLPCREGRV